MNRRQQREQSLSIAVRFMSLLAMIVSVSLVAFSNNGCTVPDLKLDAREITELCSASSAYSC